MDAGGQQIELDFAPALAAVRRLARIARGRPDIIEAVHQLARAGTLLICRLERTQTSLTGQTVSCYYPSGCFEILMAAAAQDRDKEEIEQAACHDKLPENAEPS